MALIQCSKCGKSISDKATVCPGCGCPIRLGKLEGTQSAEGGKNWYFEVLKKYAVFDGRARRTEYWMYHLFTVIILTILIFLEIVSGDSLKGIFGMLQWIYLLGVAIPSLAVGIRRLHDTNRSGWWLLLALVPLVGALCVVVLACQDSTPGSNQYGPNPKGL